MHTFFGYGNSMKKHQVFYLPFMRRCRFSTERLCGLRKKAAALKR